jgi:hypothetical protein
MSRDGIQLMVRHGEAVLIYRDVPRLPAALQTGDLPVVISDNQTFLQLSMYGPPQVRSRLVYLVDFEAARHRLGMNNGDRLVAALSQSQPLAVEEYKPFVRKHGRFLFYGAESMWEWHLAQLRQDGAELKPIGPDAYEVCAEVLHGKLVNQERPR